MRYLPSTYVHRICIGRRATLVHWLEVSPRIVRGPRSVEYPAPNSQSNCGHCPYSEQNVPFHETAVLCAILLEICHDNFDHSKHGWKSHVRERCRVQQEVLQRHEQHERVTRNRLFERECERSNRRRWRRIGLTHVSVVSRALGFFPLRCRVETPAQRTIFFGD